MTKEKPIHLLVVDDEPFVNQLIQNQLTNLGYRVSGTAFDGPEAVKLTCQTRPDVVLMDLQMPDPETGRDDRLAGLRAAQTIQEECPTPVILLTAHESPELVQQASTAGVGAYLVKPPDPRTIERTITVTLARFEDMMELRRLNAELQAALAKVKLLSGLLPICANCKKIRDDEGYWHQVEVYVQNHSEAEFTHGLCPECAKKLYPDFFVEDE